VFDVNGQPAVNRQQAEAGLHGRPCALGGTKPHRLPAAVCKKIGAPCADLLPYLDCCCGGRQRVQKRWRSTMKPDGVGCIAWQWGKVFKRSSRMPAERRPRARTILPGDRPRAYIRRTWEMFSEAVYCQARTIVQSRRWSGVSIPLSAVLNTTKNHGHAKELVNLIMHYHNHSRYC